MKKIIFLLSVIFGVFTIAKAQHCHWCNFSVIIVEVRDHTTNEIINDLDIRLTDSTGKPYTSEWNIKYHKTMVLYQNTDTLKFGQNHQEYGAYEIPFGINCYMLLVYPDNYPKFNKNGIDKILITDKEGRYENTTLTFNRSNIVGMCTNSKIRGDEKKLAEITLKVNLKKKS